MNYAFKIPSLRHLRDLRRYTYCKHKFQGVPRGDVQDLRNKSGMDRLDDTGTKAIFDRGQHKILRRHTEIQHGAAFVQFAFTGLRQKLSIETESDNACGITAESRGKILDLFNKDAVIDNRKEPGLPIARRRSKNCPGKQFIQRFPGKLLFRKITDATSADLTIFQISHFYGLSLQEIIRESEGLAGDELAITGLTDILGVVDNDLTSEEDGLGAADLLAAFIRLIGKTVRVGL